MDRIADQQETATCSEELQIFVRFDAGCWFLEFSPSFETLTYPSGAAAEEAARRVAARFALQGQAVHVVIEDRRHALVGTQTYFACEPIRSSRPEGQA